ncbi:uncharacterized protein LOC115752520 [Rhodamnia argentea]|uniref:Uncharacterized protein LOC115752520 n=1 Tax=Rhodamnia argentea TaxID=178133 RepID=A0A8B8QK25_9MYRT|nr:uncharacterized protein LOC115752520 [Rhodamnia argentea]
MNTEEDDQALAAKGQVSIRGRRCLVFLLAAPLLLLFLLSAIALVLSLTLLKPRDLTTRVVSATLSGISPRVALIPVLKVELNVTLKLILLVHNPNHFGFRHGPGKSIVLYRGRKVGEADVLPGEIPARKSEEMPGRMMLEVDRVVAEDMVLLVRDVLGGELVVESRTRIPGRVRLWKVWKRHTVVTSECRYAIRVPAMRIQSQECEYETEF